MNKLFKLIKEGVNPLKITQSNRYYFIYNNKVYPTQYWSSPLSKNFISKINNSKGIILYDDKSISNGYRFCLIPD